MAARHTRNIVDRPIWKSKGEASTVSFSAFAFLFSELIQYSQTKVKSTAELENRLEVAGGEIGRRLLELLTYREKAPKRKTRLLDLLKFVHTTVWPYMFGKTADSLEQANAADDEYMISDVNLALTKYISVPRDMGSFNPGALAAGIVKGILDAAGFPARVSTHYVDVPGLSKPQTTILMKFEPSVMQREARLEPRAT
ncbi:unnamed protein product [Ostreobium quekettii]|uniref:Trafficking protein particle complex subunit n=1 Tax=Ostreobium quekettii TaxID=121088 RepID=A0A8S1J0Q0_9CHLO|nr:unnamed protein product [Ostreobium quekettii]|eukprot:evm.model.scf_329EXC.7 EVM.evm.TU.scf_329EXC.7   scf_329EXC:81618-85508(+)